MKLLYIVKKSVDAGYANIEKFLHLEKEDIKKNGRVKTLSSSDYIIVEERMSGVRETKQITNAMYLVASTKLRHAREALDKTRPYFDALRRVFMRTMELTEPETKEYNAARKRLHILDVRLKKGRGAR